MPAYVVKRIGTVLSTCFHPQLCRSLQVGQCRRYKCMRFCSGEDIFHNRPCCRQRFGGGERIDFDSQEAVGVNAISCLVHKARNHPSHRLRPQSPLLQRSQNFQVSLNAEITIENMRQHAELMFSVPG